MFRIRVSGVGGTISEVPYPACNACHVILGEANSTRIAHIAHIHVERCIWPVNKNSNVPVSVTAIIIPYPVIKVIGAWYHCPEYRLLHEVIAQRPHIARPGMLVPYT